MEEDGLGGMMNLVSANYENLARVTVFSTCCNISVIF